MTSKPSVRGRVALAAAGALLAATVQANPASADGHTGTIWFCTSSTACASNSNSVTSGGTRWVSGSALIPGRSDIAVRYALASGGGDDCHTGIAILTNGTTNAYGILSIASVTMPTGPGQYVFCATNGTGDNGSAHRQLLLDPGIVLSNDAPAAGQDFELTAYGLTPNQPYRLKFRDAALIALGVACANGTVVGPVEDLGEYVTTTDTGSMWGVIPVAAAVGLGVLTLLNTVTGACMDKSVNVQQQKACEPPFYGGLERDFKRETLPEHLQGCQRHHMPAQRSYVLAKGTNPNLASFQDPCRPVVIMRTPQHQETATWANRLGAPARRDLEASLMQTWNVSQTSVDANFSQAFELGASDVTDPSKFGTDYVLAASQARAEMNARMQPCNDGTTLPRVSGPVV